MDRVAAPYAKAIFEFLDGKAKARNVVSELLEFCSLVDSHKELKLVCTSEVFSAKKQRGVVDGVSAAMKLSKETQRILSMLTDSKRLKKVDAVAEGLKVLLLESQKIVSLEVEASEDLSDTEKKAIEQKFKAALGQDVEATFSVAADLLGGIRVTAGSKTYDGTLATRLMTLKERLVGGSNASTSR